MSAIECLTGQKKAENFSFITHYKRATEKNDQNFLQVDCPSLDLDRSAIKREIFSLSSATHRAHSKL
jgi:hypothetical protein